MVTNCSLGYRSAEGNNVEQFNVGRSETISAHPGWKKYVRGGGGC